MCGRAGERDAIGTHHHCQRRSPLSLTINKPVYHHTTTTTTTSLTDTSRLPLTLGRSLLLIAYATTSRRTTALGLLFLCLLLLPRFSYLFFFRPQTSDICDSDLRQTQTRYVCRCHFFFWSCCLHLVANILTAELPLLSAGQLACKGKNLDWNVCRCPCSFLARGKHGGGVSFYLLTSEYYGR
jgi:hypothetical protein